MSNPATKLTPKMTEALEYIDAYGNAGPFKTSTLTALVNRGLIDDGSHGVRSGAEWNYRVTAAGIAIMGRKDSAEQPTAPMPTLTDHTGWGVIADAAGTVQCVGVHTTRDESEACATRRGVRPAAAPCCSLRSQGVDCGCADAAADRLTGFETEDDEVEPVDNRSEGNRLVLDNTEIGLVLGTSINPVTGDTNGIDLLIDGSVRNITLMTLNLCDVKAVCGHGYGPNDSCPGCDREDELIRNVVNSNTAPVRRYVGGGIAIELGTLVWEFGSGLFSALNTRGVIVARHVSTSSGAERALELDHKVRSMSGAYNDNVLFDARKLDEQAAGYLTERQSQQQIDDTVRLLHTLGITTAEAFFSRLEALDLEVDPDARRELLETPLRRPVRLDGMIVGPANLWGRRDDGQVLPETCMTAAESFEDIDFSVSIIGRMLRSPVPNNHVAKAYDRLTWVPVDHAAVLDNLERTHPVVTAVHDGSQL